MTNSEILEQMALDRLESQPTRRSNKGYDEDLINQVKEEQLALLGKGFDNYFDNEDSLEPEEVRELIFGTDEDNLEVVEEPVAELEQVEPQETEAQKALRELKEENERIKAENQAEREILAAEKRQNEEDQNLILRAMEAMAQKAPKEEVAPEPVKAVTSEDLKSKSKKLYEKIISADDSAGDELADLIAETLEKNKSKSVTAEEIAKVVEKTLQENEAKKYNIAFEKANKEFVSKNADLIKDPVAKKLFGVNFQTLQQEYHSKGVLLNPEDLFEQAKAITLQEVESTVSRKVVQKNSGIKVSESLQEEARKSEAAKAVAPKAQGSAKVDANPSTNKRVNALDAYEQMVLRTQGIKFKK